MMNNDGILATIKKQKEISLSFVQEKRQKFRDNYILYNYQRRNKDLVGDPLIFSTINTLMALTYLDKMSVSFSGRAFGLSELADKWEKLAKFDYGEMNMDQIDYQCEWDKYFYGVGIRVMHSFDTITKTPKARTIDPISWLPDPNGGIDPNSYRWHIFEVEYSKSFMTAKNGFIQDVVKSLSSSSGSETEIDQTKSDRALAQALNAQFVEEDFKDVSIQCFDCFLTFNNKKYFVTVDGDLNDILRIQEIKPVMTEEFEDPSKIPFPVSLKYFSPERGNPFGTSIPDLTEDKQRALSVLTNLKLKILKSKLYPMYTYNKNAILNKYDLTPGFNKMIPVNGNVNGALAPVPKDFGTQEHDYVLEERMEQSVNSSTGIGDLQNGIQPPASATATGIMQSQNNASNRYALIIKYGKWSDKQFWRLWMREYKRNRDIVKDKVVRVANNLGTSFLSLDRKDFETVDNLQIEIVSELDQKQKRESERLSFSQAFPMIMQDPSIPEISRKYAQRKLLRLNGVAEDEIFALCPKSPQEVEFEMNNELLSHGKEVEVKIGEDHLSAIFIAQQAHDTPEKQAYIAKHRELFVIESELEKQQAQANPQAQQQQQNNFQSLASQAQNQIAQQVATQDMAMR